MIDWHSHILPKMDDGSHSVAETFELLNLLKTQGVKTVVATPHYYANDESIDDFLQRRQASYELIEEKIKEDVPNVVLGAEVKYYSGISKNEHLDKLKIQRTNLLLLEMPMSKWTEYTVRELVQIAGKSKTTLALAHIERYLSLQTPDVLKRLYQNGILMQVNSSFFADFFTRNKAIRYLCEGKIHLIGSDCHNTATRSPKMDKALDIISRKLGNDFISQMSEYQNSLFK